MKKSTQFPAVRLPHNRKSSYSLFGSFTALAAMLVLLGWQPNATAQTENFDGGASIFTPGPNQWLKSEFSPTLTSYTFPAVGSGTGVRIRANAIPGSAPGVAVIYRTNIYSDFYVAVDFVAWAITNQAILLTARANNVSPITDATEYLVNYDVLQDGQTAGNRLRSQLQLSIVFANFVTIQLGVAEFTLVPGGTYRIVFKGVDNAGVTDLTVQAYDHTDLTKPLVTLFNQDSTYVDGVCGIGNFSRHTVSSAPTADSATDSTFDNYYAAATDPNLDIAPAIRHPLAGTAQVVTRTPAERFTNFHPPASGIAFTARTFTADNIKVSATKLYLNNVDKSSFLSTPADAPTVSFTTPTSPLVANTVYTGRIEVESVTGLKGTNIFWFDTFSDAGIATAPFRTIECEEYNFTNDVGVAGFYQVEPIPVSGVDTNGAAVNGSGVGYYGLGGLEGVDFHDLRTTPEGGNNHFRALDPVGTWNLDLELLDLTHPTPASPWDPPIVYEHTRLKYASLGMKEYVVHRTNPGEWLNYTRVFANQNYNVYLRVSSFFPTELTLDTVTSDPTLPAQTTTPLGRFYVPNQFKRDNYRYQPLFAAGVPAVVNLAGTKTIRLTLAGTPIKDERVVYLNYLLFVPTTDAVTSPVVLESASVVTGPYTAAAGASVNLGTKTITVPLSGSARFYRIRSDVASTIATITIVGPNVVITYN